MSKPVDRRSALRHLLRVRRASLTADERAAAETAITVLIAGLPVLQNAAFVAGYRATRGEANIDASLALVGERGTVVTVPRVVGERLEFLPWDPSAETTIGSFGIEEPVNGIPVPFARHTAVLTPLVAFDRMGRRLGQGGGFYDRMMSKADKTRPVMIGVAYAFQEVEEVPSEPWDQPLDAVVTQNEVIEFPASGVDLSGEDSRSVS